MATTVGFVLIFMVISIQGRQLSQNPRILGGKNVKQGEYPFVVALRSPNSKTDVSTATVLTHNWLMTDGWTCFLIGQDIQAIVGTVNLNQGGRVYQVARHIKHPEFQESDDPSLTHPNDICLVELKQYLPFNEDVNQVTLPPPDYDFPDATPAIVPGWGTTTDNWQDVTDRLKIISTMKAYRGSCPNTSLGSSYPFEGQICADSGEEGVTPCSRDEGSPLVYNDTIQIGIQSFYIPAYPGATCSHSSSSAYTKVSHYLTWILAVLGDEAKFLKIATYDDVPKRQLRYLKQGVAAHHAVCQPLGHSLFPHYLLGAFPVNYKQIGPRALCVFVH